MSTDDETLEILDRDGYAIVPDQLDPKMVAQLRRDLEIAIEKEVAYHKGTNYSEYAMAPVCCTHARSFVDVLEEPNMMRVLDRILSPGCIIYAYGSTSMPPKQTNYSRRIHVDSPRYIPGYATNAGVMMILDDFTEENGATWILAGSHHTLDKPADDYFFANARRIIAKAGSLVFLNPRVWHAGGINYTDKWRHSITLNMCRPYMKQRLDIPKMMAKSTVDLTGVSEGVLQKLGYYAQVPESLDEYYQPLEKRKFRQTPE